MATPRTPEELAKEALEALKEDRMTSKEHVDFLVERGIIDRTGRVLVSRLFGEQADETAESDGEEVPSDTNASG